MEVFMHNLPPHLADASLQKQLQPFMERLSIKDYLAEKQRKKTTGRLTFLREADGKRFLQLHGERVKIVPPGLPKKLLARPAGHPKDGRRAQPQTEAYLTLMGKPVYCRPSDRRPDEFVLKSIEHEASRRHALREAPPPEVARVLEARELHCGHHSFRDGRMVFTSEWRVFEPCLVKFAKRNLIITLPRRRVELRIAFQSIVELVWSPDGGVSVTLSWTPTILARPQSQPGDDDQRRQPAISNPGAGRHRPELPSQRRRLEAIDPSHAAVAAYCLVYHFRVSDAGRDRQPARHASSGFYGEMSRMRQKQLFPVTRYPLTLQHGIRGLLPFDLAAEALKNQLADYNRTGALPFDLLFLLQALLANGYLHPATISALARRLADLFRAARKAGDDQPPVSVDAFKKLFEWIDYPSPDGDPRSYEPDGIVEYLLEAERLVREGHAVRAELFGETPNRARIFRAVVTPTRVLLHGPELEPMNRVLRKFPHHRSYFLRAQFCDEDGQDLFFNARVSLDDVYGRFRRLLGGIAVAGRVYKLLGFSHSSLRTHSAWLCAPFVHGGEMQFPELIIRKLGDFGGIRSPARRAARIGQAFSETPYAVDLDAHGIRVVQVADVERNGRVFSDGVGTISPGAVEAIHAVVPESKGFPTCFQIRWAGAKGMLSLDARLPGNTICIRPSMSKFESDEHRSTLEICDMASRPMPLVLNRQLIAILESMGAPPAWFLALEERELRRLRGITASVYNTASFLRAQRVAEGLRPHRLLRETEAMGLDYRADAFLRAAVEAVLLRELRLLKHRARIPVREGVTLFGVMDETGLLPEGHVYVTYDWEPADGPRLGEPPGPGRRVIVSRSPALHPGDAQTAYNTVPPDGHPLRRLRNCLVFSMHGQRDLPSQLSGGDLDGDVFHVIWDPDVVDSVTTFEPADYPRLPPVEVAGEVTLADIADFFVSFMQVDHLGVIAVRHMILADKKEDGVLHPDCIKLAGLHSSAVDFSKTGRVVELKHLPPAGVGRPDFLAPGPSVKIHDKSTIEMEEDLIHSGSDDDDDDDDDDDVGPRKYRYYRSGKTLGLLYRAVDENKIWAEDIRMKIAEGGPPFWDKFLARLDERVSAIGPVEWQHRVPEAQRIRYAYEDAIHGLMVDCAEHPHKPLKELEVFVGFIMNKTGVQSQRQRDRSVKLKDEFERITAWIMREMRHPLSVSGLTSELDALELCLACLHVGCQKPPQEHRAGHRSAAHNIESFKIVAASALLRELAVLERGTAYAAQGYLYADINGLN